MIQKGNFVGMCLQQYKASACYVLVHNSFCKGFVAFSALSTMKYDCCHGELFF